ncbi:MAG: pimeloyl-ACP methyl ester carboxylesterase [Planctomycetota bacterium]|jgi:pimeloyl-ACP methyl ester carboxylesterase
MSSWAQLKYNRSGSGKVLVMQHGYLGSHELWRAQIDYFSQFFDVITPDLAGFGANTAMTAPESIDECADLVFDLLDHLGVDDCYLIGHSMGGMIVQQMAITRPQRVSKLICFGTGPVGLLPNRFETLAESHQRIESEGLEATANRIAATWFIDGEKAPGFEVCRLASAQASKQAAIACLLAWEKWNVVDQLDAITMPTLVVWGDSDRSYGWSQPQALWQGIKSSQLAVMPGCAHNAHMEKPALFNQILHGFLDE